MLATLALAPLLACGSPQASAPTQDAAVEPPPAAIADAASAAAAPVVAPAAPAVAAAAAGILQQALARQVHSDLAGARGLYRQLLAQPGTAEAAEAAFRLGQVALLDGDVAGAIAQLEAFRASHPDHERFALATLLLGHAYEQAGDGGRAIALYRQFQIHTAQLGDYLGLRTAALLFAAGRAAEGWAELNVVYGQWDGLPTLSGQIRAATVMAEHALAADDPLAAAIAVEKALTRSVFARRPARTVAELAQRWAQLYQQSGRADLARASWRRIVLEWPRTPPAMLALRSLPTAERAALSPFQRGLVLYANGWWADAAAEFAHYVGEGSPQGGFDEALYLLAMSRLRQGARDDALPLFAQVAHDAANSRWADQALREAGILLQSMGQTSAAAARFERLAVLYPQSPYRGQALFWLGRLLPRLGMVAQGHQYMVAAAGHGPEDYYTVRAREILRQPPPPARPLEEQVGIGEQDFGGWQEWLAQRGVAAADQAAGRAVVEEDLRFQRGMLLLAAGFVKDADEELRELAEQLVESPPAMAHLAVAVRERGLYPLSVTLGHRLFNRLQPGSVAAAPKLIQKLMFPLAYAEFVVPEAQARRIDPLLLWGLIKQESWFDTRAVSRANARGLTQFIPATARTVAEELGVHDFQLEDMHKPPVAARFGAYYLKQLIDEFRGNQYFALAGYNGGPGNVLRWARGDWQRDIDVFVEEIGFRETRDYVMAVTANYELYRLIYSAS